MPFNEVGSLRYYTFDLFDQHHLVHGIFTRQGGVSPQPWASLNLGGTVGDARENVVENRRRIFEVMNLPVDSIYDAWQVHGTDVICTDVPRPLDSPHQKGDGILTNRSSVTLFMRFADCVPIFLYDPQKRVAGLVHAGWRGTVDRAAAAAVEQMVSKYGSRPEDIIAGIGPSICVDHYAVGEEVVEAASASFGARAKEVLWQQNGSVHMDLWHANQIVLEESGVGQVEQAGLCTFIHNADWYSHRAEQGSTGRFGALLALGGMEVSWQ
jgi:polyphenol oxidase